jgi:hypothetical protein
MVDWFHVSGPMMRRYLMAEEHGGGRAILLIATRKHSRDRKELRTKCILS